MGQRNEAARTLADEVLPVFEHLGATREQASLLAQLAEIAAELGDDEDAVGRYGAAVRLLEASRDTGPKLLAMAGLAEVLVHRGGPGDHDAARRLLREITAAAHRPGMPVIDALEATLARLSVALI